VRGDGGRGLRGKTETVHMRSITALVAIGVAVGLCGAATGQEPAMDSQWTIYVANDNCPDYTWGLTEQQTRKAFADVVRGHLDEMSRTDKEPWYNQDRYNAAVTMEVICFMEQYPQRKDELIRRIKEGRVYVSPYLCNSLWAFQSVEGAIRTFYPARRLEREFGIPMEVAEHTELPSLPWGVPTILAGCGVRWLSLPFYAYDSTFGGLKTGPVFIMEGPDGSQVRVVMDRFACGKASYMQGAHMLRNPAGITKEWLPHYRGLGKEYPAQAILASGTHGDISPGSGNQAREFAEAIIKYNAGGGKGPKLVNATVPMFCKAIDEAEAKAPFMKAVKGCFGHSWDVWPVCLAKYVAEMRQAERSFLTAEALVAVAAARRPDLLAATQADRRRGEWCWAMLSDHAWNGTDDNNKRQNAELRRDWAKELAGISGKVTERAWFALGLKPSADGLVVFNSLSVPRAEIVRAATLGQVTGVAIDGRTVPSQAVEENGRRFLYFVTPQLPGFGFGQARYVKGVEVGATEARIKASATELESPYYRLTVDAKTGGVSSLVHKASGKEVLAAGAKRTICQTVFFDGKEQTLSDVKSEVVAAGAVLGRVRVSGRVGGMAVANDITVYADLDRVDFDVRVNKPVTSQQQRLCQVFPVMGEGATLRAETTGAVIRPMAQPKGDLLPGADTKRLAVQGFVDCSVDGGLGVTIAPLDAFVLRMDLDAITFEAMGNDQNYKEVVQDQHGQTEFRFRYSLKAHEKGYGAAEAMAWSRAAATPLAIAPGETGGERLSGAGIVMDPRRAVATCLKPADAEEAGGVVLRLWETAGETGPVEMGLAGYERAWQVDLLERELKELAIVDGQVRVEVRAKGFGGVRLVPGRR